MIGSGLKKLALENGMKVDAGVAYGLLRGYAAAMYEGAGFKAINVITKIPDAEKMRAFMNALNDAQKRKEFRIGGVNIDTQRIQVAFTDNPGTMGKIRAFMDWFFPLLDEADAEKGDVCGQCGGTIVDNGTWILLNGNVHHIHSFCVNTVQEQISSENTRRKEEVTGSYGRGAVGALLGAALGAVVWAVVLMAGYLASLVGLLIGFLSSKAYDLFKGKQGKGKVAILIIAVIFGVVLGTVAGYGLLIAKEMNENGTDMAHYAQVAELVLQDPEVINEMIRNLALGLLFSGLGVFGLLRKEGKNVADIKVKILK